MAFRSLLVWGLSSATMAYVYYGVLRLPRGFIRLVASLPLITFYFYMAIGFETVFERGNYSFFYLWLTSFKIVLLCWDDGPAADPWAVASFPRFLAVMTLSLQIKREKFGERKKIHNRKPKAESEDSSGSVILAQDRKSSATRRTGGNGHESRTTVAKLDDTTTSRNPGWKAFLESVDESQEWYLVILRLLFKFVLLMLMTKSYTHRSSIPSALLYIIFSLHIYIACSLVFEGIALVVSPMLGIEIEAAYNKPFLAHSLSDFWGQRWNLLVSNLMRVSIYDPMLRFLRKNDKRSSTLRTETDLINGENNQALQDESKETSTSAAARAFNPPLWPRSIAMFLCFLVSGLMHELIFCYMSRSKPTWVATIFFILNGVATLVEVAVRRKTRLRLPRYISTPLTLTFVLVTAIWFFFPAIINESRTDELVIAEFQYFFQRFFEVLGGS